MAGAQLAGDSMLHRRRVHGAVSTGEIVDLLPIGRLVQGRTAREGRLARRVIGCCYIVGGVRMASVVALALPCSLAVQRASRGGVGR